jgi:hypothetical protein
MTSNKELVSTKKHDYLDQDPPIRGQKFCCISFVSPEDVIRSKDVFFFENFITSFSKELQTLFSNAIETFAENVEFVDGLKGIKERYDVLFDTSKINEEFNFYKGIHGTKLEAEYLEKNNFQTSIRGFKVRGSYESLQEAQQRCQLLKRMDENFNVYVAEVGCWCPWSPNPEELENQEYGETHLNTLMKKYLDNQKEKDQFFLERKRMMAEKAKKEGQENAENVADDVVVDEVVDDITSKVENLELNTKLAEEDDPWMQRKKEQENTNVQEEVKEQENSTKEPNST